MQIFITVCCLVNNDKRKVYACSIHLIFSLTYVWSVTVEFTYVNMRRATVNM